MHKLLENQASYDIVLEQKKRAQKWSDASFNFRIIWHQKTWILFNYINFIWVSTNHNQKDLKCIIFLQMGKASLLKTLSLFSSSINTVVGRINSVTTIIAMANLIFSHKMLIWHPRKSVPKKVMKWIMIMINFMEAISRRTKKKLHNIWTYVFWNLYLRICKFCRLIQ